MHLNRVFFFSFIVLAEQSDDIQKFIWNWMNCIKPQIAIEWQSIPIFPQKKLNASKIQHFPCCIRMANYNILLFQLAWGLGLSPNSFREICVNIIPVQISLYAYEFDKTKLLSMCVIWLVRERTSLWSPNWIKSNKFK